MAKWIDFAEQVQPPDRKTKVWYVQTKGHIPGILGEVKWWPGWRKYCFFPGEGTLYEEDCLRDVAEFCAGQTALYKLGGKPA